VKDAIYCGPDRPDVGLGRVVPFPQYLLGKRNKKGREPSSGDEWVRST
jgi:hypothetical protein